MPVRDTFQVFSGLTATVDVAKENHDLNREGMRLLKTQVLAKQKQTKQAS